MYRHRVAFCFSLLVAALLAITAERTLAGTEFPVCVAPGYQEQPAISGNKVIWVDRAGGINGIDLVSRQTFSIPTGGQAPAISGNTVVWEDYRNLVTTGADIYGFDLATSLEFPVSVAADWQWHPAISGNTVVWADWRNRASSSLDIYGYDLLTKQGFPVSTAADMQLYPAISGNIVVWEDYRNEWTSDEDIYGKDLATGQEFPICTAPGDQYSPSISGNIVVWTDTRNDPGDWSNTDIYGYDLSTGKEFPICTAPGNQDSPVVWGHYVVWVDFRNDPGDWSNTDIYGYDLSTGKEFPICTGAGSQDEPAIADGVVVWRDWRNDPGDWSNSDIYGYRLEDPKKDAAVFASPLNQPGVVLKHRSNLPVRFYLTDPSGNPIGSRRNVTLEIAQDGAVSATAVRTFSLGDGSLRYDSYSLPPGYVAHLSLGSRTPSGTQHYTVVAKEDGVTVNSTDFYLSDRTKGKPRPKVTHGCKPKRHGPPDWRTYRDAQVDNK